MCEELGAVQSSAVTNAEMLELMWRRVRVSPRKVPIGDFGVGRDSYRRFWRGERSGEVASSSDGGGDGSGRTDTPRDSGCGWQLDLCGLRGGSGDEDDDGDDRDGNGSSSDKGDVALAIRLVLALSMGIADDSSSDSSDSDSDSDDNASTSQAHRRDRPVDALLSHPELFPSQWPDALLLHRRGAQSVQGRDERPGYRWDEHKVRVGGKTKTVRVRKFAGHVSREDGKESSEDGHDDRGGGSPSGDREQNEDEGTRFRPSDDSRETTIAGSDGQPTPSSSPSPPPAQDLHRQRLLA